MKQLKLFSYGRSSLTEGDWQTVTQRLVLNVCYDAALYTAGSQCSNLTLKFRHIRHLNNVD